MRFFFDNCISPYLTKAMKLLNEDHHEIEHLTDRFDPDTIDVVWLPIIAADPDIVIVSGDPAITTSKKEKEVWRQTGLTAFFFGGGFPNLTKWPQASEMIDWWPTIVIEAKTSVRGTGYLLPVKGGKGGKFKVIYHPTIPPAPVP